MGCVRPLACVFSPFSFGDYLGKLYLLWPRKTFSWVGLLGRWNPRFRSWGIRWASLWFDLLLPDDCTGCGTLHYESNGTVEDVCVDFGDIAWQMNDSLVPP